MCLTEMGPLYDWPNESVIPSSKIAAPGAADRQTRFLVTGRQDLGKPLAGGALRRDHEVSVKLQ
jgi:hypothetical protein